jgi:hypothetical protein
MLCQHLMAPGRDPLRVLVNHEGALSPLQVAELGEGMLLALQMLAGENPMVQQHCQAELLPSGTAGMTEAYSQEAGDGS